MPDFRNFNPEEARESILSGSIFQPINFDYDDEDDFTSSSYVSVDSAYSSDAFPKNSPLDATEIQQVPDAVHYGQHKFNKLFCNEQIEEVVEKTATEETLTNIIQVTLHGTGLWKSFLQAGNEMIVTKPGR
jgi:hypothetical protein